MIHSAYNNKESRMIFHEKTIIQYSVRNSTGNHEKTLLKAYISNKYHEIKDLLLMAIFPYKTRVTPLEGSQI